MDFILSFDLIAATSLCVCVCLGLRRNLSIILTFRFHFLAFAGLLFHYTSMNPLTLVKRIQNINKKEAALGISEDASWHAKYRDSAYVYVGGIPFDLTEGDLLAVFVQ